MTAQPGQTCTPERRATARTSVKTFMRKLFHQTRTSLASVARSIATSDSHIDRCLDPENDRQFQLADVLLLDEVERVEIAELVIGEGHAVVKLPAAQPGAVDDLADALNAQRETAEVLARHLAAIADGRMDAREGAELERECDEAIAVLLRLRARAQLAQHHRVIGLHVAWNATEAAE